MLKNTAFIALFIFQINIIAGNENDLLKIKFHDEQPISLSQFFQTVMPGKTLNFEIEAPNINSIEVESNSGKIVSKGNGKWMYIAPEISGNYAVYITDATSKESVTLNVFVLTPLSEMVGEYLNSYRIGSYPDDNYKGKKNYKKPLGLIEVTKENKDTYITPNFQLKQFLCKQSSGWPKYLLINPKLLLKLEFMLGKLNDLGVEASTIFIMSGYRTPYYNKSIGNVKFSRHVFGDAADIYIDENLDGVIDDLNNDGKIDMADAMILHSIINKMENDPENEHLVGGMGKYNKNSAHTYFIHIDTRGYKARW